MTAIASSVPKGASPPVIHPARDRISQARSNLAIVPITIEQYQQMIQQGIVPEDSTVELLRGILVRKDRSVIGEDPMGHSAMHVLVVSLLAALALRINSDKCYLQIRLPIDCPPDGEPEPDAAVIRGNPRDYADHIPSAQTDVTCVVEAAHSSLDRDREDKLPIYASAGVPHYVIINLQNRTVEVYTDPDRGSDQYRSKATLTEGQTLTLMLPTGTLEVAVKDILP
jgi:Uma2 family endonuclease